MGFIIIGLDSNERVAQHPLQANDCNRERGGMTRVADQTARMSPSSSHNPPDQYLE